MRKNIDQMILQYLYPLQPDSPKSQGNYSNQEINIEPVVLSNLQVLANFINFPMNVLFSFYPPNPGSDPGSKLYSHLYSNLIWI